MTTGVTAATAAIGLAGGGTTTAITGASIIVGFSVGLIGGGSLITGGRGACAITIGGAVIATGAVVGDEEMVGALAVGVDAMGVVLVGVGSLTATATEGLGRMMIARARITAAITTAAANVRRRLFGVAARGIAVVFLRLVSSGGSPRAMRSRSLSNSTAV